MSRIRDSGDPYLIPDGESTWRDQNVYSEPMARWARVVVSGVAHHVTQRGNRRQPTFFQEDDCRAYLDRIEERLGRGVRPAQRGPKPEHEGNSVWCPAKSPKSKERIAQ